MTTLDTEAPVFSGGGLTGFEVAEQEGPAYESGVLASPFASGLTSDEESAQAVEAYEALLAELEDEGFDEAVESLVDEVAGRHLTALAQRRTIRSRPPSRTPGSGWSPSRTRSTGGWRSSSSASPTAGSTPSARTRPPASWRVRARPGLGQRAVPRGLGEEGVQRGVGGREGRGPRAQQLIPMGPVFAALRKLVRPLLQRVLSKALNRLPAPLRGPATQLAQRSGSPRRRRSRRLREGFDAQLAEMLLAPSDAAQEQVLGEAMADGGLVGVRGPDRRPGPGARDARPAARPRPSPGGRRPSSSSSSSRW